MPEGRDAVAVVGLAAAFPGLPGIEELWVLLMTGAGAGTAGTAVPSRDDIVAAAIADSGHGRDGPFGTPLAVIEARGADPLDALRAAACALRRGTCAVAVVAAADPGGACALVLRRLPDALADHDDVRALVQQDADGPADDLARVPSPRLGTGPAAVLAGFAGAVLALSREVLPDGAPAGAPLAWPPTPGRRRAAAAGYPCTPLAVEAPPAREPARPDGRPRVLPWTGPTVAEERAARYRLAQHLVRCGDAALADIAATLQEHSDRAPVRAVAVCTSALDAAAVLGAVAHPRVRTSTRPGSPPPLAILFPGVDEPAAPAPAVLAAPGTTAAIGAAVARLWISAGIRPAALVASGAGVVAAATAAGVVDPPLAARLLAALRAPDPKAAVAHALRGVRLRPPAVPLLTGPDGAPWTASTDPQYWLVPELDPAAAVDVALGAGAAVLVEAGPGGALTQAAGRHPAVRAGRVPAFAALGADGTETSLLDAAARLWAGGHDVDWAVLGQPPLRRRAPLPAVRPVPDVDAPATSAGAPRRTRGARSPAPDWIQILDPDAPGPTVLALPYAGGSGRVFRSLRRDLPDGCALAVVDLPGHGRIVDHECLTEVEDVLAGLEEAVAALPVGELVLLGYSLGGSFAHELTARLHERGTPPLGLIVCGTRAPHLGVGHPPVAQAAPGVPFLTAAAAMQLAAPEMLEFPELARAFAAPLHADLAMVESFPFRVREPLPVPGCVVGFRSDWLAPEPALRAWDDLFASPPLHLRPDGGHLAIHDRPDEVRAALAAAVAHVLAARPAARADTR